VSSGLEAAAFRALMARSGLAAGRFVDCAMVHRVGGRPRPFGGVWDRMHRRWATDRRPARASVVEFSPAQFDAARWFADWLDARLLGIAPREPVYAVHCYGGRRAGKSWVSSVWGGTYAVAVPGSIVWAVCPSEKGTAELQDVLQEYLPEGAYEWRADAAEFRLVNGSIIKCRGGYGRSQAKEGRIDFVVLNEAQLAKRKLYQNLRGGLADSAGLAVLAYNPPDSVEAEWLEKAWQDVQAGKLPARSFFIDNRKNPHIEQEALEALAGEMDERDFLREIRGIMGLPYADTVFDKFVREYNVGPVPEGWTDVTEQYIGEVLDLRDFARPVVLGQDFDKLPHLATSAIKLFCPPGGDVARPHPWVIDEFTVQGEESDVVEWMLERYPPEQCLLVADASGNWQDVRRSGLHSIDFFKEAGYRCVPPARGRLANPHIKARLSTTKALLCNARKERRLHILPGCTKVIDSFAKWERKNGVAYRQSKFAHINDAVTYPLYWLFGRIEQLA